MRISYPAKRGEPVWDIAQLFPEQGEWGECEYLALDTNRLVDFDDGFIEVHPVPTTSHQLILTFLYHQLLACVAPHKLGEVFFAGIRVRLWKRKYRQPDLIFMLAQHRDRIGEEYWEGADLVMEVVSGDDKDRKRDLVEKPVEYARARIPEYWIVDPKESRITVLHLKGRKYMVHGAYRRGEQARSKLLQGFAVDVTSALSARK